MVRHSDIVTITEAYIDFMKSVGIENSVLFEHHSDVIGLNTNRDDFNSDEFHRTAKNLVTHINLARKNEKDNV